LNPWELKTMKKHQYIVYRQESVTPDPIILITAETDDTILDDEELVDAIRAGVTSWVRKTKDGRDIYAYAGDDMNIGDLSGWEDEFLPYCPNIHSLSFLVTIAAPNWVYDTSLCNSIDE
jgi:S-adenosylmethionine hydrolase